MSNETTNNTLLLRSVLQKDKLSETNFLDWYKNLRIVLKHEKKIYVLEKPVPKQPADDAPKKDVDAYEKHVDDTLDISCLLLAMMIPKLQKQHENMDAYDMIMHLKKLFSEQASQKRYDASNALFE